MSKEDFEAYVVTIRHVRGKRVAERKYLQVPLDLATGNYERLSDLQLREFTNDCIAEDERRREAAQRREATKQATGTYDPLASQITRRST